MNSYIRVTCNQTNQFNKTKVLEDNNQKKKKLKENSYQGLEIKYYQRCGMKILSTTWHFQKKED